MTAVVDTAVSLPHCRGMPLPCPDHQNIFSVFLLLMAATFTPPQWLSKASVFSICQSQPQFPSSPATEFRELPWSPITCQTHLQLLHPYFRVGRLLMKGQGACFISPLSGVHPSAWNYATYSWLLKIMLAVSLGKSG